MVGNKQITCGVKGWMGRLPECEVVICSPPHGVVNGTFSPNNDEYEYGDVVLYRCKKHHTLIGSRSITCSEDGTFKPEPPTCRMIECKDPQIVNGYWDAGSRPPHRPSSTVTFKCNYGYIMKGADTQTCEISGEWSPGLPTCERKNCGQAADVTNGHVNYSKGTRFGDRAVITCQTGYTLVGNRQIRCGDKGWMGSLPVCEVVKCFPPPVVVNGTFSPKKEEYEYGDVVLYSCFKGYTVDGSKSATCSEDGTLKPDPPTCFTQNCSKPTLGPHMNLRDEFILLETFPDGTKVYLTCEVGYAPAGGSTVITCSAGSWSRVTLRCERKHCGSAGEITNGQVEYPEGTQFGDKALFHCDIGYTLVGNREIMCGDKGWMGRLPVCEVMICSPPHGVVNGTFSPNNDEYNYGDVVLYSCNKDNTLIGSRSITCSEDGTFKPEPPTCRMVECKDPQIVNGKWQTGSRPPHRPSSTVTLNCNSGYLMKGAATQTCEISGEWSPGLPTCERMVECKDPQIVNGQWQAGSRPPHRPSSTVTFKCNSGYIMKGAATQTCEISGEWSPGLPTCELKSIPPSTTTTTTTPTTTTTTTAASTPKGGDSKLGPIVGVAVFGDDIVICSESREQVEEHLERWRSALENRGMKLSRSKTEYMWVIERDPGGTVRLQGAEVKKVQDFKYLGSTVQSNGECGKEVKR
ncbi:hypothetical protein Q8A73_013625 [Channa argus]|nr:hypothetical protein Q8A73_013625 [Channa argus]